MATYVSDNVKLWMDGVDLSGFMNAAALEASSELQDATAYGHTTKGNRPGLHVVNLNMEGFQDFATGASDPTLWARINSTKTPIIMSPDGGTEGDNAFLFRAVLAQYTPSEGVGEMATFNVSAEAGDDSPLVNGTLLLNRTSTSSSNSSGSQLGAVATGQRLIAAVQVLAASGSSPTLDVTIESDDNGSFTSATTQITFTQATAQTTEYLTAAGAIADDWFRAAFAIGGGSPSFTFVVAVGIA